MKRYSLCLLLFVATATADVSQLQVHSDLEATLVAMEPVVVSPVALTFDDQGRMYVVEMRDYPYGLGPDRKAGGTVRLLEDVDRDGKFEKASLFAERLSFPTSIAPWKGGVLVAAPPSIVFLKDNDGDGKAEVREILFDGFVLGVTDSNMSGLRWGLDNRVHGVNGGNGGRVRSLRKAGATALELGDADFSFDPATGDFGRTFQTTGGFGLVFDEWGHSFSPHNVNHMQQRVIEMRFLERNTNLPPREATASISDHGEMARIYPISVAETRVNHPEQAGHFSSSGAMGFIGNPAFKGDLYGSLLVADVVGNLVHRDILEPDGPIFKARRAPAEQTSEFLASRENSFRPTAMELGPDGALYIADMQRDVIEHPDYIPEKVRNKLNIRGGENRGRIYRLAPKGGLKIAKIDLRRSSTLQLVRTLSHSNQWMRATAQRLLVERNDPFAIGFLQSEFKKAPALGRLHILWTLHGVNGLTEEILLAALDDKPELRENAILLIRQWGKDSPLLARQVFKSIDDESPRVRFQVALSLGELNNPAFNARLGQLYKRDQNFPFTRLAVLSSLRQGAIDILKKISLTNPDALRELADLAGAEAATNPDQLAGIISSTSAPVLQGLQTGLKRTGAQSSSDSKIAKALAASISFETISLTRTLNIPLSPQQLGALRASADFLADRTRPTMERIKAAAILSFAPNPDALFAGIAGGEAPELQQAVFDSLRAFNNPLIAKTLLEKWRELSPSLRIPVLNHLLQRPNYHDALLTAIESNRVPLGELNLDLEQRRRLLRRGTPEIRARASKLMSDEEYSNRKAAVEELLAKLPAGGDAKLGREMYDKICAQCHTAAGRGFQVGPDLSSVSRRSVEDLLSNILDPNMAINPAYIAFQAELENGDLEAGILAGQTADAITLVQAGGKKVTLARGKIKKFQSTNVSLMPEGLEAGLTPADLRNLIAFLQEGAK